MSRPPAFLSLWVDPVCMARHAQSLNSSLHAWVQNLEALVLDHTETGEKTQNVISSVEHKISLIFAIHVSIIPLFNDT